jgi:DNA-binding beta-propeller fold protein YncE
MRASRALAVLLAGLLASALAAPRIFVLKPLDATISVIDRATLKETSRIATGKGPHRLYLTPDERPLIVANAAGNSLTFVDPASGAVQRTLRDVADPHQLRLSPDMKWFVIASNRLDRVDLYRWQPEDAAKPLRLAKRVEAAKTPSHLAIDSRGSVVYVAPQDSDELLAVDLATLSPRWGVKVGKMPADIVLTPDDRTLLVGLTGDRVVEAWEVASSSPKPMKRLTAGDGANASRAKGDRRHVFVSNRVANTVGLIDYTALAAVAEYPAPCGPDCLELFADGRTPLIGSRWPRKLTLVDIETKKVVRQVAVGRSPHGVWTLDHAPRQ